MRTPLFALFFVLLFSTVLPHSMLMSGMAGSIVVFVGYTVFGCYAAVYWHKRGGVLHTIRAGLRSIYPIGFVCLSLILLLTVFHIAFGNYDDPTNALTGLVVPAIVVFNFVYVPRLIPPNLFLKIVTVITALLVLVGGAIHLAVALAIVPVSLLWPVAYTAPVVGSDIAPLMSITANPNILGRLVFVGTIASLVLFEREH